MNLEALTLETDDETFKDCLNKLQTISNTISSLKGKELKIAISLYQDLYSCIDQIWTIDYFEFMYMTNRVYFSSFFFQIYFENLIYSLF